MKLLNFKKTNSFSFFLICIVTGNAYAQAKLPGLSINLYEMDDPDAFVPALKIVSILTILAVSPAILLMMSSFTRIVIVLSFFKTSSWYSTDATESSDFRFSLF